MIIHEDNQCKVVMFKIFRVDGEGVIPVDIAANMLSSIKSAAVWLSYHIENLNKSKATVDLETARSWPPVKPFTSTVTEELPGPKPNIYVFIFNK